MDDAYRKYLRDIKYNVLAFYAERLKSGLSDKAGQQFVRTAVHPPLALFIMILCMPYRDIAN